SVVTTKSTKPSFNFLIPTTQSTLYRLLSFIESPLDIYFIIITFAKEEIIAPLLRGRRLFPCRYKSRNLMRMTYIGLRQERQDNRHRRRSNRFANGDYG